MKMSGFLRFFTFLSVIMFSTSCRTNVTDYILGLKENIHHDDFEYSVSDYIVTRFLKNGSDTLYARGVFYLVNFKVENRAKRVDHRWNNAIGYLVDEKGRIYENLNSVQQYWNKIKPFGLENEYITKPGSSDSTYLAFDLPFDATKPFLKVRGDILMGDVFNRVKFKRMMIRLF